MSKSGFDIYEFSALGVIDELRNSEQLGNYFNEIIIYLYINLVTSYELAKMP